MGKNELTKNSIIVFATTFISSASTFIFQIMMGRSMEMDNFGWFNVLLSIQLIFSVFTGALILLFTHHAAMFWTLDEKGKLHGLYTSAWRIAAIIAVASICLVPLSAPLWMEKLRIESILSVLLASLLIASYFLQAIPLAFVRGMQKFYFFFYGLGTSGVFKVLLGAMFIYIGITVENALFALLLSVLLSIFLIHRLIIPLFLDHPATSVDVTREEMFSYGSRAVGATFFPMFFINVDMILIRSLFDPEISGHYAAFGVFGKLIFLGGQIVAVALFPATVSGDTAKVNIGNDLIGRAIVLVLLGGGAAVGLSIAFPEKILQVMFKINDPATAELLPYYCGFILAVSVMLIEANHRLARKQYGFLWVAVIAAFIQVAGIIRFSDSLENLIKFQLILFSVAATVRVISLLFDSRERLPVVRENEGG